jgi:transcriptional regulator with XRE-family HTH domain
MTPMPPDSDADLESPLGAFIRHQRELQKLSMRQLADLAGISNPYLSQIEHGLREPSEKVLDALARNLEVSVETLYERGGRGRAGDREDEEPPVVQAIRDDPRLTARQRQALLEVYKAFVGDRGATGGPGARS